MNLKKVITDGFRDRVEKQPNPWQPYRGDAGGEGWQNMITGEIRYQDARPAPGEGVPDDYEGDVPQPDEEPPDSIDEIEISPEEAFADGDEITVESVTGDELDAEIVDIIPGIDGSGPVVEDENGEEYQVTWDEVLTDPEEGYFAEEPPDGWADGWADPPDDHEDFFSGQTVEIYDLEEGVYKQGEVRKVEEWDEGIYVDISTEDGDVYEFLDGEPTGSGEGSVITAAEDLISPDIEHLEVGDFNQELKGEGYIWNEHTGELVEGEVTNVGSMTNDFEFETEDGDEYIVGLDSNWHLVSDEGEAEIMLRDVETIEAEELQPDTAGELAALHDGAIAEIEHPSEGSVVGIVDVVDHGEKGRHLYVGDSEVGIPLDDPDHPLAQIDVGRVESQWLDVEQSETGVGLGAIDGPVDLGSELYYGGEVYQVTSVDPTTGELELDDGEFTWSADEAASLAEYAKPVEMPPDPSEAAWDSSLPDGFKTEDTVAYLEDGEIHAGRVEEHYEGNIALADGTEIDLDDVRAWADTGFPVANQVDMADVHEGVAVTIAEDTPGGVEHFEAYITDAQTHGVPQITAMTADGEIGHYELDQHNYGVSDVDTYADAGDVIETVGDWENRDADEMVNEFYDRVVDDFGHDNYLSKFLSSGRTPAVTHFFKERQEELRTNFMRHFPPDEVEGFYDAISNWKHSSGADGTNRTLEEAFREAMDIEARVRGEREDSPHGPSPPQEWVKMAEVASKMSQRYYEDVVAPNTGGQLTRDCASTSLKSFMLEWAENPDADEFGFDGRALNNFQINPGSWNDWRVTPNDVDSSSIGLMADMMFNPMETNTHEDEIWVISDDVTVAPSNVGVGSDRSNLSTDGHFGGNIDEWSPSQVETVSNEIAQYYQDLTVDESEVYRPDELTDQQVETFLHVAERADEEGVAGGDVSNWIDLVEAEAVERGISSPDAAADHPILDHPEELPEGTEVTMRDHGEEFPGLVIGHEDGKLEVENADTGHAALFGLEDLQSVEWASERYGAPTEVDMSDYDVGDFDELEDVYSWSGGDWQEATVLSTDDDTVEVSFPDGRTEFFNETEVRSGDYVVPQDEVASLGEDGDTPTVDTGDYVEVTVPDSVDYDAESIMAEVSDVDPDGGISVPYDDVPWLDEPDPDSAINADLGVSVDAGQYEPASDPSEPDPLEEYEGGFSEGTTVKVNEDHDYPGDEVEIGEKVELIDGAKGTVVDIDTNYNPKVYLEDAGSDMVVDEGDVITAYPDDDIHPDVTEPDDFGAITDGFDDIDDAEVYVDDTVEYIAPDGSIEEGTLTETFPSMDSVHIEDEEDPVHFSHVRPPDGSDEVIGHEDISLGTNVTVEHFDPGIGTTDGTVIGFDEDKMDYVVDLSDGEGQPAPSQLFYAGVNDVENVTGSGEVNTDAVQVVSDDNSFTQDLPGAPDYEAGDPFDPDDLGGLEAGDALVIDVSGGGETVGAEVLGSAEDPAGSSVSVEFPDGSTKVIDSNTSLDLYEAADVEAEGSDGSDILDDIEDEIDEATPGEANTEDGGAETSHVMDAEPQELDNPVDVDEVAWDPLDDLDGYEKYFEAMNGVDEEQFEEELRDHHVVWTSGGYVGEGKVVDYDNGMLVLEDGNEVSPTSITQRTPTPYEPGEADEGSAEFSMGDPIDTSEFQMGEVITVENYGGHNAEVVVDGLPDEPGGPVTFTSKGGVERFLYWPDGEVEEL